MPDPCEYRCRKVDVRDRASLESALQGSEVIYNLAAVHRDHVHPVSLYNDVNVGGAVNICDVARRIDVGKIVFTSSVAVYGRSASPATEECEPAPQSAYGRSKWLAEQIHREWYDENPASRSLVIVRPTVVFGEDNRGNVYELFRRIAGRRFAMIGSGRNEKSMAYVGNVVAFLVHVLKLGTGTHVFNYVDAPDLSMQALVNIMHQEIGSKSVVPARLPYLLGYGCGLLCDIASALTARSFTVSGARIKKFCSTTKFSADHMRSTGFKPPVTLHEALRTTIRYEARRFFQHRTGSGG